YIVYKVAGQSKAQVELLYFYRDWSTLKTIPVFKAFDGKYYYKLTIFDAVRSFYRAWLLVAPLVLILIGLCLFMFALQKTKAALILIALIFVNALLWGLEASLDTHRNAGWDAKVIAWLIGCFCLGVIIWAAFQGGNKAGRTST